MREPVDGWRERAARVIAGGSSTGSKRPAALYGTAAPVAPTHFVSANGCRVTTPDGRVLVDFTMSLGAVALGYAERHACEAAANAAGQGNVSGLPHLLEVELAERLCEIIPCAEQVRFLKSGAEGMAAAVRLARAATGRELVLGSGYFGWSDWCSDAPGVPDGVKSGFRAIPFDDIPALERAVAEAGSQLAAITLEPVVERMASVDWVRTARRLCDQVGAVLILDEMKTGFRLHTGGYQALHGVTPHMAVFGKALANGFPLSAVVGERGVMEAAARSWISSTLAGETVSLAAASAVLDVHAARDVCGTIRHLGEAQMRIVTDAIESSGVSGVRLGGMAPMWFLRVTDEARWTPLLEALVARGVLLKRGAYNFPSLAHDDAAHDRLAGALTAAFRSLDHHDSGHPTSGHPDDDQ